MPKKITLKPSIASTEETPPFDAPEPAATHAGDMVSLRDDDISGAFPVLKVFQDFLETERQQARKRMMTMTFFFGVLLALVVSGFLLVFSVLFNQLTSAQNRLLDTLSDKRAAMPATPPAFSAEQTARQIALAAKQMETNLSASLSGIVGAATKKMNDKVAAQDQELAQLRDNLLTVQKENQKLRGDMLAAAKPVPVPAPPAPVVLKSSVSTNVSVVSSMRPASITTGMVTSVSAHLAPVVPSVPVALKSASVTTHPAASMKSDLKGYQDNVFTFPARSGMDTITWHALTPVDGQ